MVICQLLCLGEEGLQEVEPLGLETLHNLLIFTGASSGTGVALGIQVGLTGVNLLVTSVKKLSLKFLPQGSWDSTETATFSLFLTWKERNSQAFRYLLEISHLSDDTAACRVSRALLLTSRSTM